MDDGVSEMHGVRVQQLPAEGAPIATEQDALDIIGDAGWQHVDLVVIPVERLDDGFFRLETRVAGDILQKFVSYRLRVAFLGDISAHVTESTSLRDLVRESNRGTQAWFVGDLADLDERLS